MPLGHVPIYFFVRSKMKISTFILLIIFAISVSVFYKRVISKPQVVGPNFHDMFEVIEWAKIEAPKDAKENYGITLDFTDDSIRNVEVILTKIYKPVSDKEFLPPGIRGTAILYGAYTGECIVRNHKGSKWERDQSKPGLGPMPVTFSDGSVFPVRWCLNRLVNGNEDNVWFKYQTLVINREEVRPNQSVKSSP